jgi:purine-binding chemotaxis protein CheW
MTFALVSRDDVLFGLAMDCFVAVVGLERGAPEGEGGNAFVEGVLAFRDNALIVLSAAAIAGLVRRDFRVQQQPEGDGESAARKIDGEAEARIFLGARIDRVQFAIPVEHVSEVVEGCDVTPLFKMPPLVRGLINLRGQVLACLDVSTDLGLAPRMLEERNQFVVLQGDGAALALCVDRVTGIRRLVPERFQKADLVLSGEMTRYTTGVIEVEDGAVFLLSVPAIFEAPALQPYRRQEE